MKEIIGKIIVGVMIFIFGAVLLAGITIEVKNHFKVNYELPQADKDIKRNIKTVEKDCLQKDSLQTKKNVVQNKFIYDNRGALTKLQDDVTEIKVAVNALVDESENSSEIMKEIQKIKDLLSDNNHEIVQK